MSVKALLCVFCHVGSGIGGVVAFVVMMVCY